MNDYIWISQELINAKCWRQLKSDEKVLLFVLLINAKRSEDGEVSGYCHFSSISELCKPEKTGMNRNMVVKALLGLVHKGFVYFTVSTDGVTITIPAWGTYAREGME